MISLRHWPQQLRLHGEDHTYAWDPSLVGADEEEVGHEEVPDAESRLPMEGPSSLHLLGAVAADQTKHVGCEHPLFQDCRRDRCWDQFGTYRGLGLGMPCRRRRSFLPGSSTWLAVSLLKV